MGLRYLSERIEKARSSRLKPLRVGCGVPPAWLGTPTCRIRIASGIQYCEAPNGPGNRNVPASLLGNLASSFGKASMTGPA